MLRTTSFILLATFIEMAALSKPARAQGDELPVYLKDRGTGIRTSIFGTYVRRGELLVSPFFE
ncbi:MAG: hypothetical protein ACRENG_14360, partial [bacterium]